MKNLNGGGNTRNINIGALHARARSSTIACAALTRHKMRLNALLALISVGVGGASPAAPLPNGVGGASPTAPIPIDGRGASLRFDGHGGLSAGASSRLLRDYAEPYRSQVLDFLFKPSFGAALQINKVEIGGDTQSTDGTEASFRHYREEPPQCGAARGYEMWLLQEGHARNPDIESYLLSWGVPAWVGNGSYFSAENIEYQVQYAACVRANLGGGNPHYIGIWNERSWGSVDYVVSLRNALDAAGLAATKIVLPDGGDCAQVAAAAEANATFAAAVYALGEHYPCRRSCPALAATGLAFWASEDYSTVADWAGAGCWGRSLSQNFVLLNATSTIAWSTIWSVYTDESYFGNGLMCAFKRRTHAAPRLLRGLRPQLRP
jgi:galactosylceramidase